MGLDGDRRRLDRVSHVCVGDEVSLTTRARSSAHSPMLYCKSDAPDESIRDPGRRDAGPTIGPALLALRIEGRDELTTLDSACNSRRRRCLGPYSSRCRRLRNASRSRRS